MKNDQKLIITKSQSYSFNTNLFQKIYSPPKTLKKLEQKLLLISLKGQVKYHVMGKK